MVREVSYSDISKFGFDESRNSFVRYLGYVKNFEVVGFIEYNDLYENIDIVNVYVDSSCRRCGIGEILIRELISKSHGKYNITLEVNVLNDAAIALYEKCGFKKVAIRKGYYKGVDGAVMELIL